MCILKIEKMMLPDEIIQQKEWQALTVEEKHLIADLAQNADEFYMMKSMLQFSSEAADEVPVISATVKECIDEKIAVKKSFRLHPIWYAAAAFIILAIAIPSILKQQPRKNDIAATEDNRNMPPKVVLKKDTPSSKEPVIGEPIKVDDKKLADQQIKKYKNILKDNSDKALAPEPALIAQVSTSVSSDLSLLDFVTAVE
jgi:hypothetical protein